MSQRIDHDRYVVSDLIGEGAMGLVYRAFDRELGHDVALKTLRAGLADDVYHLKREFRSLVDLEHPNLVRLYDLVVNSGQCFFTMELVQGPRVDHWVRMDPSPGSLSRRAASALWQLSLGLGTLHAAGKLHRDIKPSNVLVTPDDRVVLLDMGLVTHFTKDQSRKSQRGQLAGTLEYMAPEQGRGEILTPAADWYSVGLVLYEALAGALPWAEPGRQHYSKTTPTPPPLHERVPGLSPVVSELVMGLLSSEPGARPTPETVLGRLNEVAFNRPAATMSAPPKPQLVGRALELHRLREVFDACSTGGPHVVCVTGHSGIGKSTLVDAFVDRLEASGSATIFRSRCHYRELVPFKAIDGLVDQLSRHLVKLSPRELEKVIPKNLPDLARVFPVLDRVRVYAPTLAPLPRSRPSSGPSSGWDAEHRAQQSAFACLRELFARIAALGPIVLWIDDLQWGDLDSVRLLKALLRTTSPILFLFSYRESDTERSPALRSLLAHLESGAPNVSNISVRPLSLDETEVLARSLLDGAGSGPEVVRQAAESAHGSPLFVREIVRELMDLGRNQDENASTRELGDLIRQRVARLPDDARDLLELISVAGCPLAEHVARRSPAGDPGAALSLLRNESLLRVAPTAHSYGLDVYHDQVRDAINAGLPSERRKELHRRLAHILESLEDPDPHLLVHHFLMAEEPERAARAAHAAAERAAKVLAFDLAASLLERSLELGLGEDAQWRVHERIGRALSNAGRGAEAAAAFARAARSLEDHSPGAPDVARLHLSSAEHLLRCGILERGQEAMYEVLRREGIPFSTGTWQALTFAVANRPRVLWRKRNYRHTSSPPPVQPSARQKLQLLWSAGVGLSAFFPMRAIEFQVRHALLAYQSQDAAHVARALSTEAVFLALEGSERSVRDADATQLEATRIAEHCDDVAMRTHVAMNSAAIAFFSARHQRARDEAERAILLCREHGEMGWELVNSRLFSLASLGLLGELNELRERQADALEEARERDDHYALTCYSVGLPSVVWLADDEPGRLRARIEPLLETAPPSNAHFFLGILAIAQADLYEGDAVSACRRIREGWPALKKSFNLRIAFVRIEALFVRARVHLALAEQEGDATRGALLRDASADARRLRQEPFGYAAHYADVVESAVAWQQRGVERSRELLERAALGFEALHMALLAAACRRRLAEGWEGVEHHHTRANFWFEANGVAQPERLSRVYAPGFGLRTRRIAAS